MSYRTTRSFIKQPAFKRYTKERPSPSKDPNCQGWNGRQDPLEKEVEDFLKAANEPFYRNHEARLDFYLPRLNMFIECKRFYTPRIADQLSRVPERDVIVIQGIGALRKLLEIARHER